MDKVDHPVFFLTMKRLFIALFVIAGMAAVLGVSASAAGTITATLSEPIIEYTYTDDPDDPFESFSAYASYAGHTDMFWTSEDPDLLMIPDTYLVFGMRFWIVGSTALGNSARSNTITYDIGVTPPALGVDVRGGYWDFIEWSDVYVPSSVYIMELECYHGNTMIGQAMVYSDQDGWYCLDYDIFNYLCFTGALRSISSGDYITFRLVSYNSSGYVMSQSGNLNYKFVNPYENLPLTYLDFHYSSGNIACSGYGLGKYQSGYGLTRTDDNAIYLDDDSTAFSATHVGPPSLSSPYLIELGYALRNNGNLLAGGAIKRSFKIRLTFYVTVRNGSSDVNLTFFSPWLTVNGLDGFGAIETLSDPLLYSPTNAQIDRDIALIYKGVKETPVYRYIFSGLVLCIPFMVGVFVINKVH